MTEKVVQGEAQPPNLTTPEGVKSFLSGSASEEDWNSRCDQVQAANNDSYPKFWFQEVMVSGLARETSARWDGTDKIKISTIKR